jgi:uncharacterized protein GlcG (DUF336 family)
MRKSLTFVSAGAAFVLAGAALAAQQAAPAAREPVLGHGPSERTGVREAGKAPALATPEAEATYSYGYPLLPHAISIAAAKAAMDACAARGAYVAVMVIDTYGIERVTVVHERARPVFELDKARRKAMTAMNDRGNLSSDMATAYSEREGGIPYQLVVSPVNIGLPGGAPLKIKGSYLVAGLGVSGAADPRIDEQCAMEGIKQVQAKLDQIKYK